MKPAAAAPAPPPAPAGPGAKPEPKIVPFRPLERPAPPPPSRPSRQPAGPFAPPRVTAGAAAPGAAAAAARVRPAAAADAGTPPAAPPLRSPRRRPPPRRPSRPPRPGRAAAASRAPPVEVKRELVRVPESVTVAELAEKMRRKSGEVIKALLELGVMAMVNDLLDPTEAKLVADKFDFDLEIRSVEGDVVDEEERRPEPARRCARRSSPSWATSTTARPRCWTPSASRRSPRRSSAASRSTSAPTR